MVLSQYDPISKNRLGSVVTNLRMQGQVEDHVTEVALVINRVLQKHQWDQLLNEKGYQGCATIMCLPKVNAKIMCKMPLSTKKTNTCHLLRQSMLSQQRLKIS